MKSTSQLLLLLSAVGTLNGLILAISLLSTGGRKTLANVFLSLLLLMLSIRVGKSALLYFDQGVMKIFLQIGLSACFFIGPSLYFYTRAAIAGMKKAPVSWLWCYGGLVLIAVLGGAIYPYSRYPETWGKIIIPFIIYLQWAVFVGLSLAEYFSKRDNARQKPMLGTVLIGNTIILLAYILSYFNLVPAGTYILGPVMYAFILYLSLFQLFFSGRAESKEAPEKYQHKKIAKEQAILMLEKLHAVVVQNNLYLDAELKLADVARKMNVPAHQLSQLLNDNVGKSFSQYIGELRIEEAAVRILSQPHIRIEEIGYLVGFNSKSAFFTAFKKIKGASPQKFREDVAGGKKSSAL